MHYELIVGVPYRRRAFCCNSIDANIDAKYCVSPKGCRFNP